MRYQTLLALHCTHDPVSSLKSAVAIAKNMRAHLNILVINPAPQIPAMAMTQNPDFDWSSNFQDILAQTTERTKAVTEWMQDKHVDFSIISSTQPLGMIENDVAEYALYADLVLYQRFVESLVSGVMAKALEGAIFDAGKPALILTDHLKTVGDAFKTITIAWDPTSEAMKSVTASLPFLKRAVSVELLSVTKPHNEDNSESSVAAMLTWLSRHGVHAVANIIPRTNNSVSITLLEHINNCSTDLVIMGAYGHTRFRERLFGGVSNTVLEKAESSLFIAH